MTAKEAIEYLSGRYLVVGSICNPPEEECKKHNEVVDMSINALKMVSDLQDRGMDLETLENYMQFEDECVKKNFTFKSIIEAREKQIAKKPLHNDKQCYNCPNCGCNMGIDAEDVFLYDIKPNYCEECGQKLDW